MEYTNGIHKLSPLLEIDEDGWSLENLRDDSISAILQEAKEIEVSLFLNLSLASPSLPGGPPFFWSFPLPKNEELLRPKWREM